MKKITLDAVCPGCNGATPATVKKPSHFQKIVFRFTCRFCASFVMGVVARPRKRENNDQWSYTAHLTHMSPLLQAIKAEEIAERAEVS